MWEKEENEKDFLLYFPEVCAVDSCTMKDSEGFILFCFLWSNFICTTVSENHVTFRCKPT